MDKKLFFVLFFGIILIPQVHAFTFFGVDFGKVWNFVTFWDNGDVGKDSTQQHIDVEKHSNPVSSSNSAKTSTSKEKSEVYVTLAGKKYTQSYLSAVFQSESMKEYVKGFNYDCVFIETDKGEKFTLNFNTDLGTLKSLKKGNSCPDREIYLEESLFTDISKDGFSAKNIKSYLEKVDLPWTMYGKALKVFTIG